MKNILLILVLFFTIVSAKEISPYRYVQASEAVTDFVKVDNLLIIGTEEGIIDIYDLEKDKLVDIMTDKENLTVREIEEYLQLHLKK